MSTALQEAIAELSKMPPDQQDRIGRWLLDELAAEEGWEARFEASQDALRKLADETRAAVAVGDDTELDVDEL